ncbi:NAD(P)-binding protein [Choiromyces venosus 120613-1]|uniref:NAD(P)-binding protein n=1 Tax=Choiromyces venosus 120613-1 TaxID=1336337 RepID=A0A3N4JGQ4_9PEZI|nr:NAD(P)-binding protein [Choiromyces venosus 120613-1]
MVKVFILGASGFIGFSVALALRRNGHRVYGLVLHFAKGLNLVKHEITPVIGDIFQPSSWTSVIESEGIDVIIDSSSVGQDANKILAENELLNSGDILDAVVIRPTMVYGGSGSLFSMLIAPIAAAVKDGASEVKVLGRKIELPLIHKDDLADFTLKVISYVAALSYPLFDITAQHESYTDIIEAAAKHMGFTGTIIYRNPEGPMAMLEQAILTQFNTSSDRARTYLGWEPKHRDIMGQIDVYTAAVIANQ